jgi:MoaA/NifB/PqqE/SkfB family radical SAM enzyme
MLVIVWRVTEACDLACPFCLYARDSRARDARPPRRSSDPEQVLAFGRVLCGWRQAQARPVLVSWLGGEPLRWPPLFAISRVFQHEYGLRVSATTNGTALASAIVREHIATTFSELTLSLDSAEAFHDQIRRSPGLLAQLRRDVPALMALARAHNPAFKLRINTVLMRDNIAHFTAICAQAAEWGAAEITFNALGGRDRPEFYPAHHLLPEQVEAFAGALPHLRARFAPYGLRILGSSAYLHRFTTSTTNHQLPVASCAPGAQFLFITETGLVAPCSFTTDGYGVPLTKLPTAQALIALPHRFATQQRAQLQPACYACPSTQVFGKFVE